MDQKDHMASHPLLHDKSQKQQLYQYQYNQDLFSDQIHHRHIDQMPMIWEADSPDFRYNR